MDNNSIDVSVYMLTYYHERYVRQAIESVLKQKTHYRYELVISDDCSKDKTSEIIMEFQKNYPNCIRVNINDSNMGIVMNIYKARTLCKGKYIVGIAGDDYWINENKIEEETSFLENHSKYVAVCNMVELRMDDNPFPYDIVPRSKLKANKEYTIRDYENCKPLGMHGFMMRNYFLTEEGRNYFRQSQMISKYVDDAVDELLILKKGPIYVMGIITDAHRVFSTTDGKDNYNARYSRLEKLNQHISLLNGMNSLWGKDINFANWYIKAYATGLLCMIKDGDFLGYRPMLRQIIGEVRKISNRGVFIRILGSIIQISFERFRRLFFVR